MGRRGSKNRGKKPAVPASASDRSAQAPHETGGGSGESAGIGQVVDRWRPWLLAGAVALLVARPLYPSETPGETGDGLPIVMLWLALAVVWMLGLLGRPKFTVRFGLLDGIVVFLVLWHVGSALLGASRSHARPAVNMLWEWVGLGVVFVLVRQWLSGQREIRAVVVVMLALAAALAGYGLFQCVYEFPQNRAAYQVDPEKALREAGLYYPAGSPERIAFEKRLESREPIATFALTNSLAGFLTAWLVAGVGIGLLAGGWSAGWRPRIGLLLGCLLIAACLLLTKSRSAYLAVLAGMGCLGLWRLGAELRGRHRPGMEKERLFYGGDLVPPSASLQEQPAPTPSAIQPQKESDVQQQHVSAPRTVWQRTILAGVGILVVLGLMVGAAFYWGGLDIQVLTEAGKSLQYRLEYWQATWQIIRHQPIWGCGPGLFRYAYTRFKLPQASEEIADPHNFLLEIWATAGTLAALAMLAFLALWAVHVGRAVRTVGQMARFRRAGAFGPTVPLPTNSNPSSPSTSERPGKLLLGAAAGVAVGFWVGQWSAAPPSLYVLMIGLPLGLATIWALWPWVQTGGKPGGSPLPPALQKSEPSSRTLPSNFSIPDFLPTVLAVAAGTVLVNLLAAGGISFAGVAGSLWLLAGLATGTPARAGSSEHFSTTLPAFFGAVPSGPSQDVSGLADWSANEVSTRRGQMPPGRERRHWLTWLDREHQVGWPGAAGGVVLTMAVFFACHQTAFSPVLERQSLIHQALRLAETDRQRAEKLLQQAAAADPLSAQPAEWLSGLAFQQWNERFASRPTEPAHWTPRLQQFEQYAFLALELNPEDAPAWFVQGERFFQIGSLLLGQSSAEVRREGRRAFQRALGCFQQAASLYPNNALYRAWLAETFAALGYQPGMIREAQAALWLDEQMPHVEKKLPEPLRRRLAEMQAGLYNTKTAP